MNVAAPFLEKSLDDIKALLAGGSLKIYSVARPFSADLAVDRSGLLAEFTFQSPAFGEAVDGMENPLFAANPVVASHVGVPGFARAFAADGTVVADFSAGPGPREIKFSEVSCAEGVPVKIVKFAVQDSAHWPERPDYFNTKPKPGYPMPPVL